MLRMGFYADDYVHQLVLQGYNLSPMKPWALFEFGSRQDWNEQKESVMSFPGGRMKIGIFVSCVRYRVWRYGCSMPALEIGPLVTI